MSIGIYKIINPKGKIYVGQSINIEKRFKEYKNIHSTIKQQIKIYNSLKKYGPENHIFETIEECILEQLNEKEIYWGLYYNVLDKDGLNLRLGDANGLCSQETKDKISKANSKPKPLGFGKKISLKQKGSIKPKRGQISEEHKNNLSKSIQGKKKNYKQNSLNFEIIKQQYELLSTNQLAEKYNISIPTMLNYLKNTGIYKFRKNYNKENGSI
jgi:group I intron endonuclease